MRWASSALLFLTIPIGELHTFWANDTRVSSWVVGKYVPMLTEWNVKFAADQLIVTLYFLAWICYRKNAVNVATVRAFFLLSVLDTILYFYNYKQGLFYGEAYVWFIVFWIVMYKNPMKCSKRR